MLFEKNITIFAIKILSKYQIIYIIILNNIMFFKHFFYHEL